MKDMNVTKEKLVSDCKAIITGLETLLRDVATQAGDKAHVVRDQVDQGIRRVKGQLEDLEHTVYDRGRVAARATDDFVHEHPWESVGVGLGIGLVLGLLLTRR